MFGFFGKGKKTGEQVRHPYSELKVEKTEIHKPRFPVVDSHIHLGPRYIGEDYQSRYSIDGFVDSLKQMGVSHALDLELFSERFFYKVLEVTKAYRSFFSFCMPVDLTDFEEPFFEKKTLNSLEEMSKAENVCGIKIWKNLGLELKRKNGQYAKMTDPEFEVVFEFAKDKKLPVVMHVADPPLFFKKVDYTNERYEELKKYPMWSYYGKTTPRFSELISQLEQLLETRSQNTFVIAHLAWLASDLNVLERLLAKKQNMYVDIAAVLSEIGRQPRAFARFAENNADRILFGTDTFAGDPLCHRQYYRFMETQDEYFDYDPCGDTSKGNWKIYGANLSDNVLKKIYSENFYKFFLRENKKE